MTRTRFLAASALAIASATMAHAEATVAFLMPDQASTRYEQHDYPGFKAAMEAEIGNLATWYDMARLDASNVPVVGRPTLGVGGKDDLVEPCCVGG